MITDTNYRPKDPQDNRIQKIISIFIDLRIGCDKSNL